jgi:hypothetical protein
MKADDRVDAVLKSIGTAEAHVRSEYVRDLPGTMATVGAVPHYALTAQPGVVSVISGREGVAGFYDAAHQVAVPQASRFLTQIATDWYMFVENMPTRTWIADGSLRTVHTVTLLITDGDGIKCEFVWERPPAEPATAEPATVGPLPMDQFRSVSLHEEFLVATCSGDRTAITAVLEPDCRWAERDYQSRADGGAILDLHGANAAADHLAQWHAQYRPERVSVLNRQATGWFVFAEELWTVRPDGGERRQIRKAVIYPVRPGGKLRGAIGYGTDPAVPSTLSNRSFGQAFWPEAESDRGKVLQSRNRSSNAI